MNASSLIGHVLELFELIDTRTHPPDRIAGDFFRERKYLGSSDRRIIAEAVFGMIRHRRFIEAQLEEFLKQHPEHLQLDASQSRYLSLYLAYSVAVESQTIPSIGRETVCIPPDSLWRTYFPNIDLETLVSWLRGYQQLHFPDEDECVHLGVKYSFQDWMVQEWLDRLGGETEDLLRALNAPASTTLRVNLLKATRERCQQRLHEEGVKTEPTLLSPAGLVTRKRFNIHSSHAFKDGWYELQDEGSQVIALLAAPKPGDTVIDACAGAGGKSLHIADLTRNESEIIAIDVDAHRLRELERRAVRAGITSIRVQLRDTMIPGNFFGKADLVLVDTPCSGVGTIRRNPGYKWSVSESLVQHYSEKQRDILDFNSQFVKPGGRLVYATCSLIRKENEDIVDGFLNMHHHFEAVDAKDFMKQFGLSTDGCYSTLYPHRHGTDGFFVSIMKRTK
ncbi:MAG: methyltransferase domain-containing protein [Ignavibacteria bacterium]|nr:methyltransferase domain-containing protein [Ignavibacteria bacterium]MBI3764875.1 methyltransferase domain-containing protein [Ignavibacteriales bacterium]